MRDDWEFEVTDDDFDQWFGGWPGFAPDVETEDALRDAFRRVLTSMPEDAETEFLATRPIVQCIAGARACAFGYAFPQFPSAEPTLMERAVLWFDVTATRRSARKGDLADVVAHEIAHVVLGHHKLTLDSMPAAREAEADQLSTSWGFSARYSESELRRRRKAETGRGGK